VAATWFSRTTRMSWRRAGRPPSPAAGAARRTLLMDTRRRTRHRARRQLGSRCAEECFFTVEGGTASCHLPFFPHPDASFDVLSSPLLGSHCSPPHLPPPCKPLAHVLSRRTSLCGTGSTTALSMWTARRCQRAWGTSSPSERWAERGRSHGALLPPSLSHPPPPSLSEIQWTQPLPPKPTVNRPSTLTPPSHLTLTLTSSSPLLSSRSAPHLSLTSPSLLPHLLLCLLTSTLTSPSPPALPLSLPPQVVARYHPLALRWFLVSTHYRQQVNYTQRALEEASDRLYYVYQAVLDVAQALEAAGRGGGGREAVGKEEERRGEGSFQGQFGPLLSLSPLLSPLPLPQPAFSPAAHLAAGPAGAEARQAAQADFSAGRGSGPATSRQATLALLDDLNTPSAVSELSAPLKAANDLLTTKAGRKRPDRLLQLAHVELGVVSVLRLLGLVSCRA
jgi:hypothetical protein